MSVSPLDQRLLLHAALDGELDAADEIAFERALANDAALAKEFERQKALRRALREKFAGEAAPAALRARIGAKVRPPPAFNRRQLMSMAASLVLGVGLGGGAVYTQLADRGAQSPQDALIAGHRRALLAASPVDVATNDRHNVRPWFDARIAVSPPTPDLAAQGFPLVGGRIDVIGGAPAPTLVYRAKEHYISVTALPASTALAPSPAPAGYHIVAWRGEGFNYWAISDADRPRLEEFVSAFKAVAANAPPRGD
jgi:anti-sigma factor RsiW